VEMKADKRNVSIIGNTPVNNSGGYDAVRIGDETKAIEEGDDDRSPHRPFPQLPSNEMTKAPQTLVSIRFVPPDRAHNVVQVAKERHNSRTGEAAQRCDSSYTFQLLIACDGALGCGGCRNARRGARAPTSSASGQTGHAIQSRRESARTQKITDM